MPINNNTPLANDSKEEEIVSLSHSESILVSINNMRTLDILTDLVLRSGSTSIKVHKCVLAAKSNYFKACLTSPMIERASGSTEPLMLNNICEYSLQAVIDYIYTGHIDLNDGNYLQILDAANQLELPMLVELCCEFLLSNLDVSNCLAIHDLAEQYLCYSLSALSESYIFRYFEKIVETEEFLNLTFDRLSTYLIKDELSMPSEEAVYLSIVKWIDHAPSTRSEHLGSLLSAVYYTCINI
jgi:hypothetical protein